MGIYEGLQSVAIMVNRGERYILGTVLGWDQHHFLGYIWALVSYMGSNGIHGVRTARDKRYPSRYLDILWYNSGGNGYISG